MHSNNKKKEAIKQIGVEKQEENKSYFGKKCFKVWIFVLLIAMSVAKLFPCNDARGYAKNKRWIPACAEMIQYGICAFVVNIAFMKALYPSRYTLRLSFAHTKVHIFNFCFHDILLRKLITLKLCKSRQNIVKFMRLLCCKKIKLCIIKAF